MIFNPVTKKMEKPPETSAEAETSSVGCSTHSPGVTSYGSSSFPSTVPSEGRADYSGLMPSNPRHDLRAHTRVKLVKLSRYLCRAAGVYTRLTTTIANYAIGSGLLPTPRTDDEEWNKMNEAFFRNWAMNPETCDKLGQNTFADFQKCAVIGAIRDGEKFYAKQKVPFYMDGKPIAGMPRILMIDPLLVGDKNRHRTRLRMNRVDGDPAVIDGVELGRNKKATAYYIMNEDAPETYSRVRAFNIMHVFSPSRFANYRGFTWLHSGHTDGIDALDLKGIEKHAAKLQGILAVLIKRCADTDPLKTDLNNQSAPDLSGTTEDTVSNGNTDSLKPKNSDNFVDIDGVKIFDSPDIENLDLKSPERPNTKMIEFLGALYENLAWGIGLTKEFVLKITEASGANIRFVIQDAMPVIIDVQQMVIVRLCDPVYKFVTATAMDTYEKTGGLYGIPRCSDPKWWKCEWSRPKEPTVDIGRDGKLLLNMKQEGILSERRIYKMQGLDPKKEMEETVLDVKEFLTLCETHNVPPELVRASLLGKQYGQSGDPAQKKASSNNNAEEGEED